MTTRQGPQRYGARDATWQDTIHRNTLRQTVLRAVVVALLAWAAVTAPLWAEEKTKSEDASAEATAPIAAGSDQALIEAALALRLERPELFGDALGFPVLEVFPDTQAAAVGLRPGDILLRYAGEPLHTPDGLIAATQGTPEEGSVVIELLRDGSPLQVELQAGRIGARFAAIGESRVPEAGPESAQAGLYDHPVLVLDPGMHTAEIHSADVDRAGRLAVTGSYDKTLRLWTLGGEMIELQATLRVPAGPGNVGKLYAVAMAPSGDMVAAGGWTRWNEAHPLEHIYLFARDGRLVKRISGLPAPVNHLAFSPDGRWLAAGLCCTLGIRLYDREAAWAEVARDTDYGHHVYGVTFAADGRLATTSYDGHVRLYDADLRPISRRRLSLTGHPFGIAFHPDGDRLAVGFEDRPAVLLLDGRTLEPLPERPDMSGIGQGNLATVAWSRDGVTLYAAGEYHETGSSPVLAWSDVGTGARRVLYRGASNTVMSLKALPNEGLLVAALDPHLAVVGEVAGARPSPTLDPRHLLRSLAVSADGLLVDFSFKSGDETDPHRFDDETDRYRFDLAALRLAPLHAGEARTASPRQSGLPIADWEDTDHPTLDRKPLPLKPRETSRSLAIHPDRKRFVLGTEWKLRAFDAAGALVWERAVPGTAYAVNITGDGRLAVAAYADGTIRWHRMDDGRELLALFPMLDKKNWVAWTPEGFYGTTPGAHGVLKWHVNRGWDQLADAYPVSQFRYLRRPDALPLVLQEGETARALGLADMARAQREVQRITKGALPPGARLYFVGIGVGDYGEAARHLRLKYADKDVKDVASALLSTQSGLYAEVKPQVLTNENATRGQLLAALDAVSEHMAAGTGGDLAVFHFSGHGALLGPEGQEQYYLLPHEVDARTQQRIRNTAIAIGELRGRLAELGRHGRVLALLDACRSGAATLANGALPVDGGALRSALAGLPNVTVLTSSSSATPSFEDEDWQNGAFTEVLLRALGKEADDDQNGLISMTELTEYLNEQLPRLTAGEQTQQPGMEVRFQSELFVSDL